MPFHSMWLLKLGNAPSLSGSFCKKIDLESRTGYNMASRWKKQEKNRTVLVPFRVLVTTSQHYTQFSLLDSFKIRKGLP